MADPRKETEETLPEAEKEEKPAAQQPPVNYREGDTDESEPEMMRF